MSIERRLTQRWHFARHVLPAQIAARVGLQLRRAFETRFPPSRNAGGGHALALLLPAPVFAPRPAAVARDSDGWRFAFLGREVAMSGAIAWRQPGNDAATQLWRMNLHYMEWLEALGGAAGRAAMRSWIAANPPYTRESWGDSWNSYTLSLRVVCWLQWLARHPASGDENIAESIAEQLDFLLRHLEADIGGNHLIKNVKALIWGAASIDGPGKVAWLETGRRLLVKETARQILPDGVHFELSPSYHAQIFADLVECHHALVHLGMDSGLSDTLAKMAEATAALAHPDGAPAQFNDAGLTMAYAPAACLDAFTRVTGLRPSQHRVFALPDAGYFGVRNAAYYLVAKIGRIGPATLPAHAHGDIGSFELSVGGHRMIVDQGVFEYVEGERRARSRATSSHNTVALGEINQADFFGAFRAGKRPPRPKLHFEPRAIGFTLQGCFQGAFDSDAMITRRIEAEADLVRIEDRIAGSFSGAATSALLLHPECETAVEGQTATIVRGDAILRIVSSLPIAAEPAVWWPDMGVELATTRLRLTFPADCRESALEIRIEAGPRGIS